MAVIYDCKNDARRASVWDTPQLGGEQVMLVEYDFTKHTGALGDYILGTLPKNSSVIQVAGIWSVAPVGTGDIVTLGLATTGDVKLMTDMGGYTVSTWYCGTPAINNTTATSWVKVTSDTDIYFTIAVGVLTAGHFYGFIRYITVPSA
jgi:hypothetical protein